MVNMCVHVMVQRCVTTGIVSGLKMYYENVHEGKKKLKTGKQIYGGNAVANALCENDDFVKWV